MSSSVNWGKHEKAAITLPAYVPDHVLKGQLSDRMKWYAIDRQRADAKREETNRDAAGRLHFIPVHPITHRPLRVFLKWRWR